MTEEEKVVIRKLWGINWEYWCLFLQGAEYMSYCHITLTGFLHICDFIKNERGKN